MADAGGRQHACRCASSASSRIPGLSPTGRSSRSRSRARSPARHAQQDQVGARRHADLPPLLRAWRLRLGLDAHQRAQPAGVQAADAGFGRAHHRRADAGFPGDPRPGGGYGPVLRQVREGQAVSSSTTSRRRAPNGCSRRSSANATTRRPSASCAAPARGRVLPSGPTPSGWGRPPSSTRTASSSTRATAAVGRAAAAS